MERKSRVVWTLINSHPYQLQRLTLLTNRGNTDITNELKERHQYPLNGMANPKSLLIASCIICFKTIP
jgi:hypothetical protein